MKKLQKINIIEEGRICSPDEMKEVQGGYISICDSEMTFSLCVMDAVKLSCGPAAVYGYGICMESEGKSTCSDNMKYEFCVGWNITCPGGENYG